MVKQKYIDTVRSIGDFLTDILIIFRNKRGAKTAQILLNYLKIRLIAIIFKRKTEEIFAGFKWHFFNYGQFVSGISHTFIRNDYFFETKTKNPLIIDAGANIGDSVIYFKALYPSSRIIAFEPDELTFRKLQENIQVNNLEEITAINKALSAREGKLKFYRSLNNPGVGTMSLFKERNHRDWAMVEGVCLSKYIHETVALLKIDTEGAEGNILQDLDRNKKLQLITKMIIEYHHHVGGENNRLQDILEILQRNGFEFQLSTELRPPFIEGIFQDILIYAYSH